MQNIIDAAVESLTRGELVILPTESVYGLAADPFNPKARQRWFAAKQRSQQQPFTIHIADSKSIHDWVSQLSIAAENLITAFWPGPLTLILPHAKAGPAQNLLDGTVGLRCVDHPLTNAIIAKFGSGLMMSSANRTGEPPPVTADEARCQLGRDVSMVVDGGRCRAALSSTILNLAVYPPQLLRQGPINCSQLESVLHQKVIVVE